MVVNEEDARYELKIRQIHSAAVEDDQLDRLGAFSLVGVGATMERSDGTVTVALIGWLVCA